MWVCPIVLCLVCSGCSIYVYWLLVGMRKNKERSHPSVGNKHSKDVVVGGYLNTPLQHNIAVLLCMPLPWIGKGNGTLLQYSCLENPMDGGAWKAAVHGVTEGRTRLKRLSSSSSFPEFPLHLPAQLLLTLQQSFHVSSFHFSPPKWNSSLFPLGYLITVYFTFPYTSLCFPLQKGLFPSW